METHDVKRRVLSVTVALLALTPLMRPAAAAPAARLAIEPRLTCANGGGAHLALTIVNDGTRRVTIDPDLHLRLEIVGPHGRRPGVIIFLFPSPGWDRIPPGGERTFLIDLATPFEGEPGLDLRGARLLLEVQIWLRGASRPWERTQTFPACDRY